MDQLLGEDYPVQINAWALSNLVGLQRWNLFSYRDLWSWLDEPFETPPLSPPAEQLALERD